MVATAQLKPLTHLPWSIHTTVNASLLGQEWGRRVNGEHLLSNNLKALVLEQQDGSVSKGAGHQV